MTTAAERLKLLSGLPSGVSAAEHLKQIAGVVGIAGALLVSYSGLPSATAAEHLLADHQQTPYSGHYVAPTFRFAPAVEESLRAQCRSVEGEIAEAEPSMVFLASGSTLEIEASTATGNLTLDHERIARLDDEFLMML